MCSSIVTSLNHLLKTKSCTYCDIPTSKVLRVFLGLVEVKLKKKKKKELGVCNMTNAEKKKSKV